MTYIVSGGALNSTHSLTLLSFKRFPVKILISSFLFENSLVIESSFS